MEQFIAFAVLIFLGGVVFAIFLVVDFFKLRANVRDLKQRVAALETQSKTRVAPETESVRVKPPPLPAFLQPPPPMPAPSPAANPEPVARSTSSSPLNWESILGVKFFAWIGGLALILGVVFFVKYAFERNLITPAMRVSLGACFGLALILVSLLPRLRRYQVPAQSLCATGIVILYADIYAAHAFYNLIPLSAETILMWIVTGVALLLAGYARAQSVAVLGIIGGFLTPALLETAQGNSLEVFGYIAVLNFAIAGVAALKRWHYLLLLAAIGSFVTEFAWMPESHAAARNLFLGIEAQFFAIFVVMRRAEQCDEFAIASALIATFAVFVFCFMIGNLFPTAAPNFHFPILLLANCGVIAISILDRNPSAGHEKIFAAIVAAALVLTWLVEWQWYPKSPNQSDIAAVWYGAIFLLFAATPYLCGTKRVWGWIIAAIAGPLQFWFVYQFVHFRLPSQCAWLIPVSFAIVPAIGIFYLTRKEHVDLASGDTRLASQGAAVLTFVSLIFPVQFEREWITLGWVLEGLALILLFRWIPNRRLRAVALIVALAAFVRLALNPAVLEYHPRTHVPILNWYLYVYGLAALAFFFSARWFGAPREKNYERSAPGFLYTLSGITTFLLMNIEIADYFSIGPTLTFSFEGNFARDMTYTIAWAAFAFVLLLIGIFNNLRAARLVAIALLCAALAKLFLHDLDALSQLYRIAAFFVVAIIAIVASFAYQKFLTPKTHAP